MGWAQMIATAPRAELEQALLRVLIPALATIWLLAEWAIRGELSSGELHGLWFAVGFLLFATALTANVLGSDNDHLVAPRRFIGIVADNLANTYFMLVMGEGGAVVMGVYLFVTFGNGFRFGRLYLHVSQGLALIGFSTVLVISDFWSHHLAVGVGILVAMIVLPFYVGVLAQRITEARRRADEANQAKGRFLANMSHEMRTPLNGVIAMADLLRETPLDDAQREIVETLSTSGQLALAQIDDVLDAAKIEAGHIQIQTTPFEFAAFVEQTIRVVAPQARYKGLSIVASIDESARRWFIGDPHHLRQVLLNLVANAVKFTERGDVHVRAFAKESERVAEATLLRIEVQDTGIGIPAEKQASIFEPFTQADDSVTRVYGGTGLGTTIARQLTRLMGGSIGFTSSEGVGSTFWIELALPIAEERRLDLTQELAASKLISPAIAASVNVGHRATIHRLRGAHVLVAEDNPTNQRVSQLILQSGGHIATIVKNGEEALDALERGGYDIAVFDLSMPIVSGLEALRIYRFSNPDPIPVLMLSANVTEEIIRQCRDAGAAEFVSKPVRPSVLLEAIERNLESGSKWGSTPEHAKVGEQPSSAPQVFLELNPVVLVELGRLSKDSSFVDRLMDGFRSDCERLRSQIADALAQRDFDAVRDAAHALKGGAGSVGATLLFEFARTLEGATHDSLDARAAALIDELRYTVGRTLRAVEAHVAQRHHMQSSM
jgi:two-component system, sensor histidine kinase RpfC